MSYSVYILKSKKNGRYYIGCSRDVLSRLNEHNLGLSRATKNRGPWDLVYEEQFPSLSLARQTEKILKKRKKISFLDRLVASGQNVGGVNPSFNNGA